MTEQRFRYQSGPLPPGEELVHYGKADPSLPDRIMKTVESQQAMAERQQRHDHDSVVREQGHVHRMERRGQVFAMVLATGSLVCGFYFLLTGVAIDRTTLMLSPGFLWLLVSLLHAVFRGRES